MSELIQKHDNRATIRWKLLTGVSALALTAYVSSANPAKAEDADRPTVWIDLGGQMEQIQGLSSPFTADFMTAITPTPGPYSDDIFIKGQKPPRFAFGFDGKISFQPEDSDWIFSAGIRYGRSNTNQHIHHQSPPVTAVFLGRNRPLYAAAFADTATVGNERHTIVDFSVGKDVGLGAWGHDGSSSIDLGVRFAQFVSNSGTDIRARPEVDIQHLHVFGQIRPFASFYQYTMAAHAERSFHGVGPSLSWNASAALAGNKQDGELTLDWGVDGAILFGRQRAKTHHDTRARQYYHYEVTYTSSGIVYFRSPGYAYPQRYHKSHNSTRSKRVTVPNVGGFVGLSMKYPNVKFSVGYRYDTFLNAMDTGIDTAKKSNVTFNGPYASISIGIGD